MRSRELMSQLFHWRAGMLLGEWWICNRDSGITTHSLFDYGPHLAEECLGGD